MYPAAKTRVVDKNDFVLETRILVQTSVILLAQILLEILFSHIIILVRILVEISGLITLRKSKDLTHRATVYRELVYMVAATIRIRFCCESVNTS